MILRIFVEKNEPYNYEAVNIKNEINDFLKVDGVNNIRIVNGYDINGITPDEMRIAKDKIFHEKGLDKIVDELEISNTETFFAMETLSVQYNNRDDYSEQLLKILTLKNNITVKSFKVFILDGNISNNDIETIKSYYINPVESFEKELDKLNNNKNHISVDKEITIVDFSSLDERKLNQLKNQYDISLSIEDLNLCQDYYEKEEKNPTITELKIFDTYWSDHCRHSTFLTMLTDVQVDKGFTDLIKAEEQYKEAHKLVYENKIRPLCFMDMATLEMKKLIKTGGLSDIEKSDEVNACSIEYSGLVDGKMEDFIFMFKNETHNHPTEIEPFGGAATCIGGGIRDPLSGRAFVYGGMRVTGSANPNEKYADTLKGKLPQRKITTVAAEGFSSYSNGIGLATGSSIEFYDEGFKAKRLECGALVALARKEDVLRANAEDGDYIVLLGGDTGRDGLGGATGSSKEHDEESSTNSSSEVQKGNPIIERRIVRLFRNPRASKMIKKSNDFGAGGVAVAVGELADSLVIHLNKVPLKYSNLSVTDIAISESQERMAVVINKNDLLEFIKLAEEENLQAVKIAEVTNNNRIVMTFKNEIVVDIDSSFLNSGGVRLKAKVNVASPSKVFEETKQSDIKKLWFDTLVNLNNCSQKGLAGMFDTSSSNTTVLYPYGGEMQTTPELGLAMKFPVLEGETTLGSLMTVGYNPSLCYKSPFHAAMYAVIESITKVVALGGDYTKVRLSFQEYFERLTDEKSYGKVYSSLMGAFLVQDQLAIPSIGGKDSMSGTFNDINVPPSLISFAISLLPDTDKIVSRAFKKSDTKVVLIKTPITDDMPDFDVLKNNMGKVHNLIEDGKILSSSIIGGGGYVTSISEMCFGNKVGFSFVDHFSEDLVMPNYTDFILEVSKDTEIKDSILIGYTNSNFNIAYKDETIDLEKAFSRWKAPLEEVFPTKKLNDKENSFINTNKNINTINATKPKTKIPVVLVPIFPGSTGEYEMEKQFKKAGAIVKTIIFKNRNTDLIKETFSKLKIAIDDCDILAIPSGMSASSEPDGSSKLISLIMTDSEIKESINQLIERKGLILGVGEGFKALLKTGLIQNGEILDDFENNIYITKNELNKYSSLVVKTNIINKATPWFNDIDKEHFPVSSYEGNLQMSEEDYLHYFEKGQIVSQYSVEDNEIYNPFNSYGNIEAMVSENGRVMGRMGLIERMEKGLYKNICNADDSLVFENMVKFFY